MMLQNFRERSHKMQERARLEKSALQKDLGSSIYLTHQSQA